MVTAVRSFFKYNDLPLGHIPEVRAYVRYHNRDIDKKEIADILSVSHPRDRAFFAFMAQSGLRPTTLCKLRFKHIQRDFSSDTVPCQIDVPREIAKGKYQGYFTFIGPEAFRYLRNYLKTRDQLQPESYLFTKHGTEDPTTYSNMSIRFRKTALKLRKKGILQFTQEAIRKPSEIRLYSLRKFFRKYANQAGFEFVQFWMGHVVKAGQEEERAAFTIEEN